MKNGHWVWVFLAAVSLIFVMCNNGSDTNGDDTEPYDERLIKAGLGASHNSVNGVAFRQSSMSTWGDTQYIVYFLRHHNATQSYVQYGVRKLHEPEFSLVTSDIVGASNNAHNSISIVTDGDGYIHMAVNAHNQQLWYYRGAEPGELPMAKDRQFMIGTTHGNASASESSVTYVEFYRLSDTGNVLFTYRQGGSGAGHMVLNRWITAEKKWERLHNRLLDGSIPSPAPGGSGTVNYSPYWQMYIDETDRVHLSWVFRQSSDVRTNANMYYAYSDDEGVTWRRMSDGAAHTTPIAPVNAIDVEETQRAERVWEISQDSNLMNQTNMTGEGGNPYILTYYGSPTMQYRVIFHDGTEWRETIVSNRTFNDNSVRNPFLSGTGTIVSPLSRPRMVVRRDEQDNVAAFFICRFENAQATQASQHRRVSMFSTPNILAPQAGWNFKYLTDFSVNFWEPSMDTDLWKDQGKLHIFVQWCHGSAFGGVSDGGQIPLASYPAQQVYSLIVDTLDP